MTSLRLVAATAAVALSLAAENPAGAQFDLRSSGGAAAPLLAGIRQESVGNNYTIDAINNGILTQARAYGASNGLGAVQTANTSIGPRPTSRIPSASFGAAQKPFANVSSGSTVSPYLNLFNTGVGGGFQTIDNYNVLVRPQLEQQRVNQQLQRQQQQLNQRVQAISAQSDFEPGGSEQIIATGHQTGVRFYSHFYPTAGNAPQRRR